MKANAELSDLLPLLPAGDGAVARAVFDRYSDRLAGLAAKHLNRKLAARLDPEDVVQSVFRTFFRRGMAGQFRIDTSAQLWRLLVRITVLKARAKGRLHTAERRNVAAELAVDPGRADAAGRGPAPDDAAELVDLVEALLRDLPPLYGRLLGLRLLGRNVIDAADELKISRQTAHRALNLLQDRLAALDG